MREIDCDLNGQVDVEARHHVIRSRDEYEIPRPDEDMFEDFRHGAG